MEGPDDIVFKQLYREAHLLCFQKQLQQPLSETEAKLFANNILDSTGLTVGWRSLKNYSFYVLEQGKERPENPSAASLDTLARYVLKAPYTNELARKSDEGHHPYWFLYRTRFLEKKHAGPVNVKKLFLRGILAGLLILMAGLALFTWHSGLRRAVFTDRFDQLGREAMQQRGWRLQQEDTVYWNRRGSHPHALTLYTLPGDNWPDSNAALSIRNLLIRSLPEDCFRAELQMDDFIPAGEWQQAGLLLLADSDLNSASVRISLAYNDFFGGNQRPKEVIVQAITSPGDGAKPEEFIHYQALAPDSAALKPVLFGNLKHTALRIEKQGRHYRFLFSGGFTVDAAFRELADKEMDLVPRYVAIFALKGRVAQTPVAPVLIRKFVLQPLPCP